MSKRWDEFCDAFREVRKVRDMLPKKFPVSMDDLLGVMKQLYGVDLTTAPMPIPVTHVRGMIIMESKSKGVIYLDPAAALAQQRFICTKEIAQRMIMTDGNLTIDPTKIIAHYVQDGNCFTDEVTPDIASEEMAKYVALEILLPFHERAPARRAISDGIETTISIAEIYQVPDYLVEFALENRCEELCGEIWKSIA